MNSSRTLGSDLYYASLSDFGIAVRRAFGPRRPSGTALQRSHSIDDFQHLSRIPDKTPTTASRFRAQIVAEPEQPAGPSVREELCLLLDRFMDQGKPVIVAGGAPKEWSLGKALLRLKPASGRNSLTDLDVRLRYAQQQAKFRRLPLSRAAAAHRAALSGCPAAFRRHPPVASHRSLLGRDLSEQDMLNIVRRGGELRADPSAHRQHRR